MATKKRYYVSVNFVCDTDGSEDEPSVEQLNEAFRTMLKEAEKPNGSIDFEVWDEEDQNVLVEITKEIS